MTKQVAVKQSNEMVPGSWRERAAKQLEKGRGTLAKLPTEGGNFLSFRNGILSLGGQTLPSPMPVVILDYGYERSYYSKPFQADVQAVPDCYSYDGVGPHPEAKTPQSDTCKGCRFDEFGSAGKGKACKEGVRLVLMHADSLASAEAVATGAIVQARLSVLNSKTFRSFASMMEARGQVLWQDVISMHVQPDPKSQYAVSWHPEGVAIEDDVLDALSARVAEAEAMLEAPYPDLDDAPVQTTGSAKRRKF